ncbi:hypothetical protein WOLCODRAFT_160435 [Wolfiporia cocos MD-104 SS10]|uniref:C3H1-type domain-containing protein n=1 Tax=Wolfiporia cocos (strain MD-104) TaxID=742152 RepID=A0A2H3IV95_WOLCO|nr:hypothetical protein WOLCODRAFT_160435 [Wolfiporia cocos MD-104 SS10]
MVSALWKACSEGNLDNVQEILKEASSVDLEIKDHTGVTPLIEAVKNGHVEVVRALLDKGADPTNASSQGLPESYTIDSTILELLEAAKNKLNANAAPPQEAPYPHDPNMDPAKGYYGPPPGAYYYGMPMGAPMLPEGAVYYPPPPPVPSDHNGMPNLPPPEVARMIPCRYFPACRYGTSCIFAHPQAAYMPGPLPPPTQYPPYDPMAPAPYPPPFYGVPQSAFPTSPNGVPMNPISPPPGPQPAPPHPPMGHARSSSEVMSPVQTPFSPSAAPPPMPYGVVPPMSPTYAHPGQGPVPVGIPPLPPLQQGPQSPPQQQMYTPVSPVAAGAVPAYPMDPVGHYVPHGMVPNGAVADGIGSPKSPTGPQADGYGPVPVSRDGMTHHRRGSARGRGAFGGPGRKPPCLFFPLGRCKNGDECRFPHVLPDNSLPYHPAHHPPHFPVRGGHRPRPSAHMNGMASLEEKFAGMAVQDEGEHARNAANGGAATTNSSRSQSSEPGSRRGPPFKPSHFANGARPEKKVAPPKPQRLPSADDFPVLSSTTPPLRSPGSNTPTINGYNGPTAAQVLQAPPPRKEGQAAPRDNSPEQSGKDSEHKSNGVTPEPPISKLPISFAAAATAAPDAAKEVAVAA